MQTSANTDELSERIKHDTRQDGSAFERLLMQSAALSAQESRVAVNDELMVGKGVNHG